MKIFHCEAVDSAKRIRSKTLSWNWNPKLWELYSLNIVLTCCEKGKKRCNFLTPFEIWCEFFLFSDLLLKLGLKKLSSRNCTKENEDKLWNGSLEIIHFNGRLILQISFNLYLDLNFRFEFIETTKTVIGMPKIPKRNYFVLKRQQDDSIILT